MEAPPEPRVREDSGGIAGTRTIESQVLRGLLADNFDACNVDMGNVDMVCERGLANVIIRNHQERKSVTRRRR